MSEITLGIERRVGGSRRIVEGRMGWVVGTIGRIIGDCVVHCGGIGSRGAAGGRV